MASKRKRFWGSNPKFKVTKTTSTFGNRFQVLSDMEDEDASSVDNNVSGNKPIRVPPIIVDSGHSFTSVFKLLGERCKYKRMSIGTKVIANSMRDYECALEKLKTTDMKYFTHAIKDNNKFKLVLFGLPQLSIATMKDDFKHTFGIEPVSIKEINTSRSNPDDALYMLEFNREQITKKEVMKIKFINGIAVHWRNPLRRSRGPTQCSKCTMYGHGASNCHRSAVCLGCGGSHDYSTCQLNKIPEKGPVINKCFNCIKRNMKNVNHRADDPQCPARKEYLEIRQKVTTKRRPTIIKQRNIVLPFSSSEDLHEIGPELNPVLNENPGKDTGRLSYAKIASTNHKNVESDNLSNERLLDIFFEAINALEKCKTKYDKLRVLGNMLRHVI